MEKELIEYVEIFLFRIEKVYGKKWLKYLENVDIFYVNYYLINDWVKVFLKVCKFMIVCDLIFIKYLEFFGIKNKEEYVVY